ncbi:MAG: hypothetical protein IRZ00_07145 [Gemmatimonadetes bacterium]|nr:hypothetical protein [Gemmatimonadota bacterium]
MRTRGGNRFTRRPRVPRRWGMRSTTAAVSLAALAVIGLAGWLLSRQGAVGDASELAAYARAAHVPPTRLLVNGARTHRIVVLGDAAGSGAAKRIAADAVRAVALGSSLDAVLLQVPSNLQPYIDAYLDTRPEAASILLAHPGLLPGGAGDDYLRIYREVWRLNQQLGADRMIRIVAGAPAETPAARARAPRAAAIALAQLQDTMAATLEDAVFSRDPKARVLIFADGYSALRGAQGLITVGGGEPVPVRWLAAQLAARYPGEVFSVLQDGPPGVGRGALAGAYTGTRAYQVFHDAAGDLPSPWGVPVGRHFDFLRQPVRENASPGTSLDLRPADYRLSDVADGYIYLGPH